MNSSLWALHLAKLAPWAVVCTVHNHCDHGLLQKLVCYNGRTSFVVLQLVQVQSWHSATMTLLKRHAKKQAMSLSILFGRSCVPWEPSLASEASM